jgi:hypothetical protein
VGVRLPRPQAYMMAAVAAGLLVQPAMAQQSSSIPAGAQWFFDSDNTVTSDVNSFNAAAVEHENTRPGATVIRLHTAAPAPRIRLADPEQAPRMLPDGTLTFQHPDNSDPRFQNRHTSMTPWNDGAVPPGGQLLTSRARYRFGTLIRVPSSMSGWSINASSNWIIAIQMLVNRATSGGPFFDITVRPRPLRLRTAIRGDTRPAGTFGSGWQFNRGVDLANLTLGRWYRVEVDFVADPVANRDAQLRIWVDGTLRVDARRRWPNLQFSAPPPSGSLTNSISVPRFGVYTYDDINATITLDYDEIWLTKP